MRSDRVLTPSCSFVRTTTHSAHVYDVMRAQLPTLELDAVFEAKEELALAVKQALAETMTVRQRPTSPHGAASSHGSFPLTKQLVCRGTLRLFYVILFVFRHMDIRFFKP